EGEVDLERADLRIDLVGARRVHAVERLQDLVPLVHVALVELVVRLDRGARDAVELVELRLQLPRDDFLELERKRDHGRPPEHILAVQATEAPLAAPSSGRAGSARASV